MERSEDWIAQARRDLQHARHDASDGFFEWACFSAQQAAEKAVKAVIQKLGGDAWGYSVADLLDAVALRFPVSENLKHAALELDKVYIASRYPDAHPSGSPATRYTQREADRLVEYASEIVRFCEGLLSTL